MAETKTATLFMNGGSQAVRLPKEFRLPGTVVRVRRQGAAVLLEPMAKRAWPGGYWERLTSLPALPKDMRPPPPLPSAGDRDARLAALEGDDEPNAKVITPVRPKQRGRGGSPGPRRRRP